MSADLIKLQQVPGVVSLIVMIFEPTVAVTHCVPQPLPLANIDECESYWVWSAIVKMDFYELTGTVVLLCLFIISAVVIVDRYLTYARATKQTRSYESRALTALYYNRPDQAITATSSFPKSPIALVVRATLEGSSTETAKPSWPAFHRAVIAQTAAITRSLWALSAIGWCSPPLGLLVTLESTQHHDYSQFGLFAGLAIALPAISMHKYLSSRAESLILETDRMSHSIIEQLSDQLGTNCRAETSGQSLSLASTTQLSAGTRAFTLTHRV
jgi:biopolymer transport protein ExbB/TolQ